MKSEGQSMTAKRGRNSFPREEPKHVYIQATLNGLSRRDIYSNVTIILVTCICNSNKEEEVMNLRQSGGVVE